MWAEHHAARLQEPHKFGKCPKPHTLNVELGRAKELLSFAVSCGYLERNPLASVKRPKTISQRETWLDDDGVAQLMTGLSAVPGARQQLAMRAFIWICLDGMMRFNEARLLRRDRVRNGLVELAAKVTKGKRSRIVALTRALEAIADIPPVVGSHHREVPAPAQDRRRPRTRQHSCEAQLVASRFASARRPDYDTVRVCRLRVVHQNAQVK